MFKLVSLAMAASFAAVPAAAPAAVGPDAASCRKGGPAILVKVTGLKNKMGKVRVQLYGSNPADFLAKGKKLRRVEVAASAALQPICIAVPKAGRYAVAVRHDANGDGKSGWSDGGGFSRNPNLSLTSLKPSYAKVAINAGGGVTPIDIVMNYRQGLAIKPIKG
ncbi:DUF2141 domain-containing protein [Allosphingosinicella flava]|uniref:DUF2141 domain-containing protein n=1 Tax=Allosphingosinicella flava TaxID=2771430 RepID=A0A7T2GJM5_9SPHN|nr:DUF2141 domain-containing protein [Sphingosinicella flava]QPQ55069.1 DUF2141 domain-containing protein [Sphingosinicella flava]